MLFTGCEHCGYIDRSDAPPESATGFAAGSCPDCGRRLDWMSAEEALALLEERREAERFRARAAEEAAANRRPAGAEARG